MMPTIFAVLLIAFGCSLFAANGLELTDSETESRNNLLNLIPVGSSATKGKELLEENAIQCFQAKDKDYLNNDKFNYIYCVITDASNSKSESWQIILYHDNDVVKGIKVKYTHPN